MTGAAEIPPGDSDGTGTALFRLNSGQGIICYELTVQNIATPTAAHIHPGAAGQTNPPIINLAAPASGSSSGCVSVDKQLIKAIRDNPELYYVNVHNSAYPGGAVRGQLTN
jgi:hypothetical protein